MNRNSNFIIGVIIVLIGLFFLGRNLGWIPYYFHFGFIRHWWPVLLIAVGVWFLIGKGKR